MRAVRFRQILETLSKHEVDYIVVGNVSAVLQGAPVTTFDLDIVHSRAAENLPRLLEALQELDAYFREQPERKITPGLSHLVGTGHQLLLTRFGPLDVLGAIQSGRDYDALLSRTVTIPLKNGLEVRMLNLETIIALKEELLRPKDLAVLPMLKKILAERSD